MADTGFVETDALLCAMNGEPEHARTLVVQMSGAERRQMREGLDILIEILEQMPAHRREISRPKARR